MSDAQPAVPAVPLAASGDGAGERVEENVRVAARHANAAAGRTPLSTRAAQPLTPVAPADVAASRDALWVAVRAFAAYHGAT